MEKVKWGVLGTAMICERDTIPGMLLANNCELYAIAGRNPEKVDYFVKQYGFQKGYYDYEALLADPEVEAVYVPLPNTLHHDWAIKALKAGKHVLCEKPIAPTEQEAEEMFAAAKENGVLLMEAFAYLHSPYMQAICDEIASGKIGKVLYVDTAFITSDYDLSNIRMRRETCGGSVYDLGVYTATFLQRVLGEEPSRVQATATFTGEKIDNLASVVLDYPSGVKATMSSGMVLATEKDLWLCRFAIEGTKGSIRSGKFVFNGRDEQSYYVVDETGTETLKTMQIPHNYKLEVEQMGRCIRNGEKPFVSEAFSKANARTIDRILKEIGY